MRNQLIKFSNQLILRRNINIIVCFKLGALNSNKLIDPQNKRNQTNKKLLIYVRDSTKIDIIVNGKILISLLFRISKL